MSLTTIVTQERRLKVLQTLLEEASYRLAETTLGTVLDHLGLSASRDLVRADLSFLKEHGLVRLETIERERGELWVAVLTDDGMRVARGREHPGVLRAGPR